MSKLLYIDDTGLQKTKLQEDQRKAFVEMHTEHTKDVVKRAGSELNLAKPEEVCNFNRTNFSIKKFREGAYAAVKRMKLSEAQSELMFGQLLRAGVQNTFNDIFQAVEVTYEAAVRVAQSNKRQEFYAPLERIGFPKQTQPGESFVESAFKGLDIELINVKWGLMYAIQRELLDDDQTGQIQQEVGYLAQNVRIHEEAYVWGRISNSSPTFDGATIPVSQTYSTVYATGVPGVSGGIYGNGSGVNATANGRLSQSQIQAGWILAKQMLDQSNRPMLVMPKLLAVSPQDVFFAEILLNSDYNPSTAQTVTSGAVGGNFSVNPIKNLTGVVASRFITNYGAFLIDPGKGFVMQRRDPTEVVQENPQSGAPFSQEIYRYKVRTRWQADFIDPRFFVNLNPSFASS